MPKRKSSPRRTAPLRSEKKQKSGGDQISWVLSAEGVTDAILTTKTLAKYRTAFVDNEIDGVAAKYLDSDGLKELGVTNKKDQQSIIKKISSYEAPAGEEEFALAVVLPRSASKWSAARKIAYERSYVLSRSLHRQGDADEATMPKARQIFSGLDANGDGAVDEDELHDALRRTGTPNARKVAQQIMKEHDTDNSGDLDAAEWASGADSAYWSATLDHALRVQRLTAAVDTVVQGATPTFATEGYVGSTGAVSSIRRVFATVGDVGFGLVFAAALWLVGVIWSAWMGDKDFWEHMADPAKSTLAAACTTAGDDAIEYALKALSVFLCAVVALISLAPLQQGRTLGMAIGGQFILCTRTSTVTFCRDSCSQFDSRYMYTYYVHL